MESTLDSDILVTTVVARDGDDVLVDAEMRGEVAGWDEGGGSEGEQPSVYDIRSVVVKKVDMLVAYPLMHEPLREM